VVLHAVYDVGGHMVGRIATGKMWDTPTVVITAVLAVATALFYTIALWKMDPAETHRIFPAKAMSADASDDADTDTETVPSATAHTDEHHPLR
jgi:hypothetical protein